MLPQPLPAPRAPSFPLVPEECGLRRLCPRADLQAQHRGRCCGAEWGWGRTRSGGGEKAHALGPPASQTRTPPAAPRPPGGHHLASTHRARGLFLHRSCRLCLASGPFLSEPRIGVGSLGESGTQEMYRHPYPRVPGPFPGSVGPGLKNKSRWKVSNIYMPPVKSQRKGTDKPVKGKLTCVPKAVFFTMWCSDQQQQQHLGAY